MTSPLNLVAVVGSLRAASVNRIVFEAATELVPPEVTLREVPVVDVPFFDQDLEVEPEPAAVTALKEWVGAADGLIFFTPEYNHSVPAVTKNALDWLSRPTGAGAIAGKPVGIVAASPGRGGGGGVRDHLAHSAAILTDRLFTDALGVARAGQAIIDGRLDDPDTRRLLGRWLERFVTHIGATSKAASAS